MPSHACLSRVCSPVSVSFFTAAIAAFKVSLTGVANAICAFALACKGLTFLAVAIESFARVAESFFIFFSTLRTARYLLYAFLSSAYLQNVFPLNNNAAIIPAINKPRPLIFTKAKSKMPKTAKWNKISPLHKKRRAFKIPKPSSHS